MNEIKAGNAARGVIKGLYAITVDEPDTVELVRKTRLVLQGGARVLQYRNKTASTTLRQLQAQRLRELTREFSVPLIINDDVLLARLVEADGVHLGKDDGDLVAAREVLGQAKLIGVSCYNCMELARVAVGQGADYVAFGSFFASSVKPGAVVAAPELLRRARSELDVPLVAIGGIDAQNGAQLLAAGADALAVISAVYAADDIALAARLVAGLDFC